MQYIYIWFGIIAAANHPKLLIRMLYIDYKLVDAIYIYGLEFDENTKTIN
jgi:hypothetical protein